MDYHLLSVKEVVEKLDSNVEKGLDSRQVSERLKEFGENRIRKKRKFDAVKVFLSQFKSFLIIILIFAAVLSFLMHSQVDAIVILVIIVLNAGIGFFQEYKAEKAIESLREMMVPKAKVLRGGRVIEIDSKKIVPGDVLVLNQGDKVMADARIIESNGLKINEAVLTGESVPEEKVLESLDNHVPLADRINMIYQSTGVVSGSAKAVVVDTGMKTEIGKISELVQEIKPEKNPFKDKLDRFAKNIGVFIIVLCILIVGLMVFKGVEVFQSFLVAVSLAVAAIPEGLPAVISIGLAFATKRMARKNVLIRKLPASETLGRATVICTDKTGTLTEEKMEVSEIYANGKINPHKEKDLLFKIGVLCNKARVEGNGDKEYFLGDPTEIALIVSAKNNFLNKKELAEQEPKIKDFAFDSNRKMMSVVREKNKKLVSYVKGAPEKIIEKCDYELINGRKIKLMAKDRERLIKVYESMAAKGLRVLGFGYKELTRPQSHPPAQKMSRPLALDAIREQDAETGLVFVGYQGMIDPPRKEVKNAIKLCKQAGIKVLMVTGDSKLTAEAIAGEIGLKGKSVDAKEFVEMSDKQLFEEIKDISIFSRISPQDKLRIINILKQKNEIVAMTGDGVNDALALKRADIGISMGIRGTDVARDSSDVILTDDNFASIVDGVREGRTVYDNIKKFVKFLLSANFSEVILVFTVMLIWQNPELLPLLPLQILWINLVTDSFPALALSTEPMESDVMKRKPCKQDILKGIKGFILVAGLTAFLIDFMFFYSYMQDIALARTMAVTASITFEMFLVFSCKTRGPFFKSGFNKYLIYAILVSIVLHLIVLYSPLNKLFYFVPLGIFEWLMLIGVSIVGFGLVEGFKWWERRR